MGHRWRVSVIIPREMKSHVRSAVSNLSLAGFNEVNLFAPRGVPLFDGVGIIKQRCHTDANESDLFAEAIRSIGETFVRDNDFAIFIRADLLVWKDIRRYLERLIEPNFCGVYFPFTPFPFFMGDDRHIPQKGFGWYEVLIQEPVSGSCCVAINKHTAALLSGVLTREGQREDVGDAVWGYRLSRLIQDLDLPSFAHTPSLARRERSQDVSIELNSTLRDTAWSRSFYL